MKDQTNKEIKYGSLSVIIPCYNYAKYIEKCVDSIISQTYKPKEIIIVDDCSTDNSREVILRLSKEHDIVKPVFLKENSGVSKARNIGVRESTSEYVTFIDADDLMGSIYKLQNEMGLILEYLELGEDIAAYSKIKYIDEDENVLGSNKDSETLQGEIFERILTTYDVSTLPRDICVKKDVILELGGYNEQMNLYEDYELDLRIARKIRFFNTGEIGTAYRIKSGGLSSVAKKKCDQIYRKIYLTYRKEIKGINAAKLDTARAKSYYKMKMYPDIVDFLRKVKKLLKKTYAYKIKELIWQNKHVIFWRCSFSEWKNSGLLTKKKKLISMKDYVKNEEIYIVEKATKRNVYIPEYFELSDSKIVEVDSPDIYIAELKNVSIMSGCGAIFTKKGCILDILANDKRNRYDYVSAPICRFYKNKIYYRYNGKETINKGIMLVGVAPFNYYHFTYEILSRLEYIEERYEDKSIPILVDERALNVAQQKELFDIINRFNRPYICLKENILYKVNELIYPSMNIWFPVNVTGNGNNIPEDFAVSESAVNNIKKAVLTRNYSSTSESKKAALPKKIFISRKDTSNSRLINEDEVAKLFEEYGFKIVLTSDMSFREQVELFENVDAVAAMSGAAFANICYCRPNTRIICFIPKELQFSLYSTLAYMCGLLNIFIDAKIAVRNENFASSKYEIDLDYCKRMLERTYKDQIKEEQ